jgi:uncharacterized alpha-E superfamily protein
MLSRAADNLYWMARYMERAENVARILDVSYRMSLLPGDSEGKLTQWESALKISETDQAFTARDLEIAERNVIEFLALDPSNPSSIHFSIRAARENARAMRVQITTEMWEAMNATWLEMRDITYPKLVEMGYRAFFDWVKERSHLFRGVTYGTMQRDEAFRFTRLGTFLERSDCTARLLDTKYHVLLPTPLDVGGAVDYHQWGALLRSVSGFQVYRRIYRDAIKPINVAELLILREDMPRSLHACFRQIVEILHALREEHRRDYLCARLAEQTYNRLRYGRIEEIFNHGLHEYLLQVIEMNESLGAAIASDFLMPA